MLSRSDTHKRDVMPVDKESLKTRLMAFDGRGLSVLGEIEAACMYHPGYCDVLIELTGDTEGSVSSGATWLIKSNLDRGEALSVEQTKALISQLATVREWPAQLHVCQSIGRLAIDAADTALAVSWLKPLLSHTRPFLRAWSLDALCHIARSSPVYAECAKTALDDAANDSAASVRARARNIHL